MKRTIIFIIIWLVIILVSAYIIHEQTTKQIDPYEECND